MPDLSAYLNVYNTALVVLQHKGWVIAYERDKDWWYARKDDWELLADDPMQLLGLVSIHEHQAPHIKVEYWWKLDEPDLLSTFIAELK